MYQNGQGVIQNYKIAVKWYKLSAEQGHPDAQSNLGNMYTKGDGVIQNYKTAVKWYRLSAEQGNADAQFHLGTRYALGRGVTTNNIYAHMWSNIAASSGHKDASSVRDIVSKKMTSSEISTAQQLASECLEKKYKGC